MRRANLTSLDSLLFFITYYGNVFDFLISKKKLDVATEVESLSFMKEICLFFDISK